MSDNFQYKYDLRLSNVYCFSTVKMVAGTHTNTSTCSGISEEKTVQNKDHTAVNCIKV
jgi:hypothetical protein